MLKKAAFILLSFILFPLNTQAAEPINATWFGKLAIEGYDSVAYFTENHAVEGSEEFELEWNNANWRFSSAENLALFESDPEKYSPQYGG